MWALVRHPLHRHRDRRRAGLHPGPLAAWYETALLLGSLPAGPCSPGLLCESMYLVFAIAVVAAAASYARGTLATIGIALGVLIALSIMGSLGAVHDWLPSTFPGATVELLSTTQALRLRPVAADGDRRLRAARLAVRCPAGKARGLSSGSPDLARPRSVSSGPERRFTGHPAGN